MFNLPKLPNKNYIIGAVIALVLLVAFVIFVFFTIRMLMSDDEASEFADLLELANSKL